MAKNSILLPDLDTVREKLANPNAEGFAINTKLYEENGIKLWRKTVAYSATSFRQIN